MINSIIHCVVDADEMPVVICDLEHTICYMNPTAIKRYRKRGGSALIGKSLFECHNADSVEKIKCVVEWFKKSVENNKVYTFTKEAEGVYEDVYMIALRNNLGELEGYYEKHESRIHETMEKYKLD